MVCFLLAGDEQHDPVLCNHCVMLCMDHAEPQVLMRDKRVEGSDDRHMRHGELG